MIEQPPVNGQEQVEQVAEAYSGEVKFEIEQDHLLNGMLQGAVIGKSGN